MAKSDKIDTEDEDKEFWEELKAKCLDPDSNTFDVKEDENKGIAIGITRMKLILFALFCS